MADTGRQSAGKAVEVCDAELGWLAGIWDGEGTIGMYKLVGGDYMPVCHITNTDYAIIEKAADILRRMGVGRYIQEQHPRNPRHASRKNVVVSGQKRVVVFLERLLPFLQGEKRLKAQLVLGFVYSRFLKPGGGRRRGGVPYDDFEWRCINLVRNGFDGNPNEHTPGLIDEINKMCSELRRQYVEAAEMAARLAA